VNSSPLPSTAGPAFNAKARRFPESHLIFLLLLLTINLAIFLPSMHGDFLWDDKYFISENANVLGTRFLRSFLFSPFGGFSGTDENSVRQDRIMQFYRPVVSLSYWLDFKIWGLNPAAFHLSNILVHLVNVALLFFILQRLSLGGLGAFFGAALFSVFPLHFENVAWISGRTDLLAFLFTGFSTLLFLRFLEKGTLPALAGSGVGYFLALLAKENALFLPVIFLVFHYKKTGKLKDSLGSLWPYALGLAGWLVLRRIALGAFALQPSGRSVLDFLATIGFDTWKMTIPFKLSVAVDSLPVIRDAAFRVFGSLLAVAFILSIWRVFQKRPSESWPAWALFSYGLALLPSALVIFSSAAISLVAWRFLYLPSAVFIGALIYLIWTRLKPSALAIGAVVLLASFYVAEINPKVQLFGKDETNFWLSIKDIGREDAIARFNIGVKTLPTDEKKALGLFDEILKKTEHPLHLMLRSRIYEELAIYYTFKKDFPRAESYFNELFKMQSSQSLHNYFNYSYYLAFSGKRAEGERLVSRLLEQFPQNHAVLIRAAKFYLIVQDYRKAAEFYTEDYRLFRNRQSQLLAEEAARIQEKKD
jgi:tetratricopeptide (TPR) repeat protein